MSWPQVALGMVEAAHPSEYAVSVVFPNLGMLTAIRVPVHAPDAGPNTGAFQLPYRGQWGVVQFMMDDARSARWMGTLTDAFTNAAPLELFGQDPDLTAAFERSGRDTYRHGNGDLETQHPDGSLLRVTHGPGDAAKRTQRHVGAVQGAERQRVRVTPKRKAAERLQVYFEQKDRLTVHLDDEGTVTAVMTVPDEGAPEERYRIEAHKDGTVRVRNRIGVQLEMLPDGEGSLRNGAGAGVILTNAGQAKVVSGLGLPVLLGEGPDYRPITRAGDPCGGVAGATTVQVLAG